VLGRAAGEVGLDLEGDPDLRADQAGQVGDDLLGDAAGVAADAGGVERDGAVEAARAGRRTRRR
jgi:hypothetical protein